MEEVWKDIPEYEGLYQVSNMGRIRSLDRIDNLGRELKGKLMAIENHHSGYKRVRLCKNGKGRHFMIHRLVAQTFLLINSGVSEINHLDGDKSNNRADNLQWCTRSENLLHAYETGLKIKKLSNEDVSFIRKHYKPRHKKYSAVVLAKKYGVTTQQIHNILSNKSQIDDSYSKKKTKNSKDNKIKDSKNHKDNKIKNKKKIS